tara:strand:+ start:832 stop:990 length:159 start_codon:yes stop_codon:yes gene_type:complete
MKLPEHCSICDGKLDLDAGDIQGYFGILPVGFCVTCFKDIIDMTNQYLGIED